MLCVRLNAMLLEKVFLVISGKRLSAGNWKRKGLERKQLLAEIRKESC